jgi:4-hydroxy-tetrahydrodipicolinate synthase
MIAATLTPFGEDGGVNEAAIERHVAFLLEGGVDALAPAGTTGEFLYLSPTERADAVRATVRAAGGRAPVIAGIWAQDADEVGELARRAERAGADALFLTTPIYYPASDAVVEAWYRSAGRATGLPLFAYHIPQYAVNGVSAAVLERLMEANVVDGIKDSTGKEERLRELLDTCRGRIPVYGASDSFALRARQLGADGFISALANIFPRTFARIWRGDAAAQDQANRVRAAVKGYGGIGALKALLRARGIDMGCTRLPFADPSPAEEADLRVLAESLSDLG